MGNIRKQDICILFNVSIVFICLLFFAATSISAAEMPQYQKLAAITDNITSPNIIAVDNLENMYVLETAYNKLMIYSHRDEYIATLRDLNRPISVAVDVNGRIFVGNHYNIFSDEGNVEVYDSDLNYLRKLGAGDGEFSQPNAIAIYNSSGNIFVADKEAHLVKAYLSDGSFDFSFDGTAGGGSQFEKPTSIAIDQANGDVIVLDRPLTFINNKWLDGARIQTFDMNGVFKEGFTKYGILAGDMYKPKQIILDKLGRIYVTDTEHHKVLVYDRDGTYLGAVFDPDNPLIIPKGIAINDANRLYIAALTLKKVEVYGITPFTRMEAAPLSLTFEAARGGAPAALQGVEISNAGDGTLYWTATTNESWITLSDTGPVSLSTLNVGVDISALTGGNYTGSITIQSTSGAIETVHVGLTVTYSPLLIDHGGPYTAQEGDTITLDASGSTGDIVLYEWDLDFDGTYDYSSASPTQSYIYTQTGTHYIKLRITDSVSETSEAITFAEISDSTPSAAFAASTTSGEAPLAVSFTNTTTGFDAPFTYEWDFNYDGTVDSTDENPAYVYTATGTYSVELTVTDSDGSVNSLTRAFYITVTSSAVNGCEDSYARIGAVDYPSIQSAYAAVPTGNVIMTKAGSFTESLSINRNVSVAMRAGYDCEYTGIEGTTTINGNMTISSGTVTIENGTIIID